jgi:hypothetical protein
MIHSFLTVASAMLARQVTDRVSLRVLVDDDSRVAVRLDFVRMLRRYQRHDSQSGCQSQ